MTIENSTFLVVEDDELDLERLRRATRKLGLSNPMVCVQNGCEALDVLRGENGRERLAMPFIILLDMNMPRMNGLEFLAELRADERIANAPVYVLTTSDRKSDIDAAYRFNVAGYIVKPVAMDQMLEAVDALRSYWAVSRFPHDDVATV